MWIINALKCLKNKNTYVIFYEIILTEKQNFNDKLIRMSIFMKAKLKKSDDNTNKYRVAANITEYHIISKLINLRIFVPKFMMINQ